MNQAAIQASQAEARSSQLFSTLRLRCPDCRAQEALADQVSSSRWACPQCTFEIRSEHGIFLALPDERRAYYQRFFDEYLAVRKAEGRGSSDPGYYLALPYQDTTGRLSDQWAMRGKSYRYFERRILPAIERQTRKPLEILDLGAGNGWLSYRLTQRSHHPVAVDLLTDPLDGLGAARHYFEALESKGATETRFPLFQAEFDNLPFADAQFDLAVFNSSFHYATDYRQTLQEARRCLRWGGRVVIIDSPVYRRHEHGEMMREERHEQFESQYGFRSDSVPSIEYIDEGMLTALSEDLNVRWEIHKPWYGLKWRLRPLKAWLAGRRPPSRFWILIGSWAGS